MAGKLTKEGIERVAAVIGCNVPTVKAVIAIESAGFGFLPDGRPRQLYERHIFSRLTDGKFDVIAPTVSNPKYGGYNEDSYRKLYIATQLDAEAALQSCSWGIGQVMGFNWRLCGERSLHGFMLAMHHNEDVQLTLMANFIRNVGAADELARRDWAGFARIYNGAAYARNKYDVKLKAAYAAAGGK